MRTGTKAGFGTVTCVVAALAAGVPGAGAAAGDLDLVSRSAGMFGAGGDGDSRYASVSASGRYVAFASIARNLSRDDRDATWDVYVRDALRGTTTLVSRATGPAGAAGDDDAMSPSISADGMRVAFVSSARNLSPAADDAFTNIYVRDLRTGVTTLVSRESGPVGEPAHDYSHHPAISADGRHVAFASFARLTPGVAGETGLVSVYVRDLESTATTLASRRDGPAGAGAGGWSEHPSLSADGRRVAFSSSARGLTGDPLRADVNVFVRDLRAGTTTLVSRAGAAGPGGDASSALPDISGDGLRVAFASEASDLSGLDDDAVEDVFVRDLAAGTTTLASRRSGRFGGPLDGDSTDPRISADGRQVAFATRATGLGGDAVAGSVVVRHLGAAATMPVGGGAPAREPDVSADGRFVVFHSPATLSPADRPVDDVFRRDVWGPPR